MSTEAPTQSRAENSRAALLVAERTSAEAILQGHATADNMLTPRGLVAVAVRKGIEYLGGPEVVAEGRGGKLKWIAAIYDNVESNIKPPVTMKRRRQLAKAASSYRAQGASGTDVLDEYWPLVPFGDAEFEMALASNRHDHRRNKAVGMGVLALGALLVSVNSGNLSGDSAYSDPEVAAVVSNDRLAADDLLATQDVAETIITTTVLPTTSETLAPTTDTTMLPTTLPPVTAPPTTATPITAPPPPPTIPPVIPPGATIDQATLSTRRYVVPQDVGIFNLADLGDYIFTQTNDRFYSRRHNPENARLITLYNGDIADPNNLNPDQRIFYNDCLPGSEVRPASNISLGQFAQAVGRTVEQLHDLNWNYGPNGNLERGVKDVAGICVDVRE